MRIIEWKGKSLKILQEIQDKQYGTVWKGYWNDEKVYILNGQVIADQPVIDDLDNRYGRPVEWRELIF